MLVLVLMLMLEHVLLLLPIPVQYYNLLVIVGCCVRIFLKHLLDDRYSSSSRYFVCEKEYVKLPSKQGRLPKSRVNGVLRVMKKMRVMKKDASDEKNASNKKDASDKKRCE